MESTGGSRDVRGESAALAAIRTVADGPSPPTDHHVCRSGQDIFSFSIASSYSDSIHHVIFRSSAGSEDSSAMLRAVSYLRRVRQVSFEQGVAGELFGFLSGLDPTPRQLIHRQALKATGRTATELVLDRAHSAFTRLLLSSFTRLYSLDIELRPSTTPGALALRSAIAALPGLRNLSLRGIDRRSLPILDAKDIYWRSSSLAHLILAFDNAPFDSKVLEFVEHFSSTLEVLELDLSQGGVSPSVEAKSKDVSYRSASVPRLKRLAITSASESAAPFVPLLRDSAVTALELAVPFSLSKRSSETSENDLSKVVEQALNTFQPHLRIVRISLPARFRLDAALFVGYEAQQLAARLEVTITTLPEPDFFLVRHLPAEREIRRAVGPIYSRSARELLQFGLAQVGRLEEMED